jgi:hypothetical protein
MLFIHGKSFHLALIFANKALSLPTFLALHSGKLQPYSQVLKDGGKGFPMQAVAYMASSSK